MSIPTPFNPLGTLEMNKAFRQPFMTAWTTYTPSNARVSMVLIEQECSGYRQDAMPWMAFGGNQWACEKSMQESAAVIEFGRVLTIEKVSLHCSVKGFFNVDVWDGNAWVAKIKRSVIEPGNDYTYNIDSDLQKIRLRIGGSYGVTVVEDIKFEGQIKA